MNIVDIVGEFDRQKHELESLKLNPFIDVDLRRLDYVVAGIEKSLLEVIRQPWVPNNARDLRALIASTSGNIQNVKQTIREHIDSVDPEQPDQVLRLELSFMALATLDFMMESLIEAWARIERPNIQAN